MEGIYPLSDIRANLIRNSSGNGPINLSWPRASDGKIIGQSAAKAFLTTGMATTSVPGQSLNISIVTDVSTGIKDANFTSAFAAGEYSQSSGADGNAARFVNLINKSTTKYQMRLYVGSDPTTPTSSGSVSTNTFGDLA